MPSHKKPGKTVLVIDDHEDSLTFIKALLDSDGYTTAIAKDGKAGLALFKKLRPDLVITDLFMPEMDGIELIRQLLSLDPDLKIIALSGAEDFGIRLDHLGAAMELGATRFLHKPVEADTLLDTVKRSLVRPTYNPR